MVQHLYALSQQDSQFYWVTFKDKKGVQYSIEKPHEFLSQKALSRRAKENIKITEQDLPVNEVYLKGLEMAGAKVLYPSKWLNAAAILASPSFDLKSIKALPFVTEVNYLGKKTQGKDDAEGDFMEFLMKMMEDKKKADKRNHEGYGKGFTQINMLNGIGLHKDGYIGRGITIAVLDAGFRKVDELPAFQKMITEGRLKGVYDFVDLDTMLFDADLHGLNVLSCMATYDENNMIGTAPGADYYLFRTENAGSEYPIEEANWVRAAEVADSIGVDIINSSLGYTNFDDSTLSYTYKMMNGKTSLASRAATIAAAKGILVCNAAGNEGDGKWYYIGAPADARGILSVGGVNASRRKAGFSSFGPTADGRLKPEISAMGEETIVASSQGGYYPGNGTSFASPVLCGMAACLWQTNPDKIASEIMDAIIRSGSMFSQPNNSLGHGIPDFELARIILGSSKTFNYGESQWVNNVQQTMQDEIWVHFYCAEEGNIEFEVLNEKDKRILKYTEKVTKGQFIQKSIGKNKNREAREIKATINGKTISQKVSL